MKLDQTKWLYVPAVMSLLALLPLPYAYYQILRIVVCVAAVMVAWSLYRLSQQVDWRVWIFGAIVLIFNPFIPLHMTKMIWLPINLVVAGLFIWIMLTYPLLTDGRDSEHK